MGPADLLRPNDLHEPPMSGEFQIRAWRHPIRPPSTSEILPTLRVTRRQVVPLGRTQDPCQGRPGDAGARRPFAISGRTSSGIVLISRSLYVPRITHFPWGGHQPQRTCPVTEIGMVSMVSPDYPDYPD